MRHLIPPPDNRPLSIVHVTQGTIGVLAWCRVCNTMRAEWTMTPLDRWCATTDLTEWAHAHAAKHLQEPTA